MPNVTEEQIKNTFCAPGQPGSRTTWPPQCPVHNRSQFHSLARPELGYLLGIVDSIAKKHYSGHFTIFSFTTHYKVVFGTPDLDGDTRKAVWEIEGHADLVEALAHLIEFESLIR